MRVRTTHALMRVSSTTMPARDPRLRRAAVPPRQVQPRCHPRRPAGGGLANDFDKNRGRMMGGPGSGGWNRSMLDTLEEHRSLDVAHLHRSGVLEGGQAQWNWVDDGPIVDLLVVGHRHELGLRYRLRVGQGDSPSIAATIALCCQASRPRSRSAGGLAPSVASGRSSSARTAAGRCSGFTSPTIALAADAATVSPMPRSVSGNITARCAVPGGYGNGWVIRAGQGVSRPGPKACTSAPTTS